MVRTATRARFSVGKQAVRKPRFASERATQQQANRQFRAIADQVESIFSALQETTPEICLEALEPVKLKAEYYCPKDTYALVDSSYLEVMTTGKHTRVELGFGPAGKPFYAVYVHERTDLKHEAPTQAKFLERAVLEDLDGIQMRLTRAYRRVFNG